MLKRIHKFFHTHYHTRYHGIYKHAKQLFVFDLALLGAAILMLGSSLFFFLWKPGIADQIELHISIGNDRVKSGEMVTVSVDYTNHSKFKLKDAILAVHLPPGFIIDRSRTPESVFSKNSTFTLGELEPGAKGRTEVTGQLWTEPGRDQKIFSIMSFQAENEKRPEQTISTSIINLTDSIIAAELVVAASALPSRPTPFALRLTNASDRAVDGISLVAPGSEITLEGSASAFTLASQAAKEIKGTVRLPSVADNYTLRLAPQVLVNNNLIPQGEAEKIIAIFSPALHSSIRFAKPPLYVEPGQTIPVEVSWNNRGSLTVRNAKLRLTFSPAIVDWRATARENNLRVDGNSLIADGTTRTKLATVAPGSGDTFTVNLKLQPSFALTEESGPALRITSSMETALPEVPGQIYAEEGVSITAPLATDLAMRAETRFYTAEGDQLGRGPLPPAVGDTTKYWVFVQITNSTNRVENTAFQTMLMPGAEFTGKQSVTIGPPIQYDPIAKTISWKHSELPAYSQTGLYFEVAATPTPDMLGKVVPLTKDMAFTARDAVVGKEFFLTRPGLTNVLNANDRGASAGAEVLAR